MKRKRKNPRTMPVWKQVLVGLALGGVFGGIVYACEMGGDSSSASKSKRPNPDRIAGLKVESGATVDDRLKDEGWRLIKAVQRAGYPCDTISGMWEAALSWKGSFAVECNNGYYKYMVEGLGIHAPVSIR